VLDHNHDHGHGEGSHESHLQPNGIEPVRKLVASPRPTGDDGERQPLLTNGSSTPPLSPILSPNRARSGSIDSISLFGHPIQNRAYVIAKAQDLAVASTLNKASSLPATSSIHPRSTSFSHHRANSSVTGTPAAASVEPAEHVHTHEEEDENDSALATPLAAVNNLRSRSRSHSHVRQASNVERGQSGGHHHGSMNMRALLLHVLGDALGNVGVISSGLIIWQTTWKYRFYSDPIISLLITVIIFSSALPLVKSASFILLQGKPTITL
jgi:solute carrier family 30 (zinc transporter), member 1